MLLNDDIIMNHIVVDQPSCPFRMVIGTSRFLAGVAPPPTAEVDVGSFGLKGDYDRWTESGEGLPLGLTSSPTRASSVFACGSVGPLFVEF